MAFFGLEEAGRYQAALSQAESQAEELEATIQRLNQAQTQGIGELAQSDAQMRKMVQSVEARLKSDLGADLTVMAKQVKSLAASAIRLRKNLRRAREASQNLTAEAVGV